nr:hypothetical protein [Jiangella rhizosphaerae]
MNTCSAAAAAAPTTSQPPACRKSCRAVPANTSQRFAPSATGRRGSRSHEPRPNRDHTSPTTTAAANEARNRASTISG